MTVTSTSRLVRLEARPAAVVPLHGGLLGRERAGHPAGLQRDHAEQQARRLRVEAVCCREHS